MSNYEFERDPDNMPDIEPYSPDCSALQWVLDKAEQSPDQAIGETALQFSGTLPGHMAEEIRQWVNANGGEYGKMRGDNPEKYVDVKIAWGEYRHNENKILMVLSDYRAMAWLYGHDDIDGIES